MLSILTGRDSSWSLPRPLPGLGMNNPKDFLNKLLEPCQSDSLRRCGAAQGALQAAWRERHFAHADACGVEDGVGDGCGNGDDGWFAAA